MESAGVLVRSGNLPIRKLEGCRTELKVERGRWKRTETTRTTEGAERDDEDSAGR
jgi:hypothetical protein